MTVTHNGSHLPGPTGPPASAPGQRMEDLLAELLSRGAELSGAQVRMRGLLDAVVDIGTDLALQDVLHRIVASACRLAGARYGALGVVGPDRVLTQFVTVGIDAHEQEQIGELPMGRGVLGLLIDEPHAVRLHDIADHPTSYGFPPNHPPMRSFLGVPVRIRGRVYGNLYLSEKSGGADFTAEDEEAVVALATAAGIAIDKARLYESAQLRQEWLSAVVEIASALLRGGTVGDVLGLVASRARTITGAEVVAVALDDGEPVVSAVPPTSETVTAALAAAETGTSADPEPGSRLLRLPIAAGDSPLGLLVAGRSPGRPPFDEAVTELLQGFAGQAAIAVQLARAQADQGRLALLEERDRIALDLHDLVIQRLFATGLSLHGLESSVTDEASHERIARAVGDLDDTVLEIRRVIFSLRSDVSTGSLRTVLHEVAATAEHQLGFRPRLRIDGPVDTLVPAGLVPEVRAVLTEALSNAARHACAQSVSVIATAAPTRFALEVTDDGRGLNGSARRSGLANLEQRATRHGGHMELDSAAGRGVRLTWVVPLR